MTTSSFLAAPGLVDDGLTVVPPPGSPGAPAEPEPVVRPDPAGEFAAAAGRAPTLTDLCLDATGTWGWAFARRKLDVLRAMVNTPVVYSSLNALKAAALAGGPKLTAAVGPDEDRNGEPDPDAELSAAVLAECRGYVAHLEFTTPLRSFLWEHLDALAEAHKLAEVVMEREPGHPRRFYRLARLKHKPRWAYRFAVDPANEVVGIDTYTVDDQWVRVDPAKYVWSAWDARDGDPRGRSILEPAYLPWTQLVKLQPYLQRGLETFGTPILYGTVGEDEEMVPVRDEAGNPTGRAITPQRAMSNAMVALEGGSKVAGTHGSDLKVIESARDGSTMLSGLGYFEAQVIRTILLQVRATVEAKHGSRADSETGENIMLTLVAFLRDFACAPVRRALRAVVAANRGDAVADRHTPTVSLGTISPRDLLAFAQAIGLLFNSGYFAESMLPETDAMLGFTPRNPDAERVGAKPAPAGAEPGPGQGGDNPDDGAPDPEGAARTNAEFLARLGRDIEAVIAARGDVGQEGVAA